MIVETALRILREEGLDAVTMRALATELDTGPASLYVYIAGRDELRQAMLDRVGRLVELEEPDPARWREQVHRLVRALLKAMEAHPGIAARGGRQHTHRRAAAAGGREHPGAAARRRHP